MSWIDQNIVDEPPIPVDLESFEIENDSAENTIGLSVQAAESDAESSVEDAEPV